MDSSKVVKVTIEYVDGSKEVWQGEAARIFHEEAWWYLGETGSLAEYEPLYENKGGKNV